MAEFLDRELAWDDEIEKDSEFVLIPEGDYFFTVSGFERGRHEGSEKLPPCPKAIIKLRVELPDGSTQELTHNLFLHSKCEGLLSAFFVGIGQKKHGEKLRMNWNNIIGARGRCKIILRGWTGRNGEAMQSNEIKKFYEPADNSAQVAPAAPVQQSAPVGQTAPAPYSAPPANQQYQQTAPQNAPAAQGGAWSPQNSGQQGVFTPGQW